jgi:hypothetical protein
MISGADYADLGVEQQVDEIGGYASGPDLARAEGGYG